VSYNNSTSYSYWCSHLNQTTHIACFVVKDGFPVIRFFDENPDAGLIAHECFHAVYSILESKKIALCHETEEVYAYLIQFLLKEIIKIK
jgi:hypothetical protein